MCPELKDASPPSNGGKSKIPTLHFTWLSKFAKNFHLYYPTLKILLILINNFRHKRNTTDVIILTV